MASGMSRTFSYFDSKLKEVIREELRSFINSPNCCWALPRYLVNDQRFYIEHLCAIERNLYMRVHQKDGVTFGKVYKETCIHHLGIEPTIIFRPESRQALSEFLHENPVTTIENFEMYPFFSKSAEDKAVPIHFLSTLDWKPARIPERMVSAMLTDTTNNLHTIEQYRHEILSAIELNQVTIICGDREFEQSINIPDLLLKHVAENIESCKIVCVHTNEISAIYETEFLAAKYACPVGSIIEYQVNLDSIVSTSACVLNTTTSFLLRCMLPGPSEYVFQNITHIIFNNVHLRESHCDMILSEIQQATIHFPDLKIILLCSSGNHEVYEKFFPNVKVVELATFPRIVSVLHLEEVLDYMDGDAGREVSPTDQRRFDIWLERYMESLASDALFQQLFVLFANAVSVDMKHSETKMTALMATMAKNKINHVSSLITLNPDYYLCDINNQNALMWGIKNNSDECVKLLTFKMTTAPDTDSKQIRLLEYLNSRPNEGVDLALVYKVVKFIIDTKEKGVILIFFPTITDLIMLEIMIKQNIHTPVQIHLLHEYMGEKDLEKLFEPNCNGTIYLATDIAESAFTKLRARYVIDTGRRNKQMSVLEENTPEDIATWISTESMNRRTSFVASNVPGLCIRLYSKKQAKAFVPFRRYELPNTTLESIFVFAKLLMLESSNIKEYFQTGLFRLSDQSIQRTLSFLKSIQVLDEHENITILGARLIDVHPDFQLGRVIMFAIALQCLNPVLSIVAALTYSNPFILPNDDGTRNAMYFTRKLLSEANNSDHLVLLRLLQRWQELMNNADQGNLYHMMSSKIFDAVTTVRAKLFSALKSIKLIHSSVDSSLSMQILNRQSFNWAQVKVCFVAGMYPNIAKIDKDTMQIKSKCIRKLEFHPVSVLREMDVAEQPMDNDRSDWIVFQDNILGAGSSKLFCSSIITAVSIAIFGGPMKLVDDAMLLLSSTENSVHVERKHIYPDYVRLHVDDWIAFILSPQDGRLILDFRKKFFYYFEKILQYSSEPSCNNRRVFTENDFLIETISQVLQFEEKKLKLSMPKKIASFWHTTLHKTNRSLADVAEFNISNKNNNVPFGMKKHEHYYVVGISNQVQIKHIIQGTFDLHYSPLRYIFNQMKKSSVPAVIFFLESNTKIFHAAAVFCPRSDPPLKQMYVACLPLAQMQELYPLFGLKFDENFSNLKIPPQVGKVFLEHYMETPRK